MQKEKKEKKTPSQRHFSDDIRFGLRGEINEIKGIKAYLLNNPESNVVITEREIDEPVNTGAKRKISTARYLEIRNKENEVVIQIRMTSATNSSSYSKVAISQVIGEEGHPEFDSAGMLKSIFNLERGYINVVNQVSDVSEKNEEDEDDKDLPVINQYLRVTRDRIKDQSDANNQPIVQDTTQATNKEKFYANASNIDELRSKVIHFMRKNKSNNVTRKMIEEELRVNQKDYLETILKEVCYKEDGQKNSKIYRLYKEYEK